MMLAEAAFSRPAASNSTGTAPGFQTGVHHPWGAAGAEVLEDSEWHARRRRQRHGQHPPGFGTSCALGNAGRALPWKRRRL